MDLIEASCKELFRYRHLSPQVRAGLPSIEVIIGAVRGRKKGEARELYNLIATVELDGVGFDPGPLQEAVKRGEPTKEGGEFPANIRPKRTLPGASVKPIAKLDPGMDREI
jgi:hypothetical protein